jgi:hypothetical protein
MANERIPNDPYDRPLSSLRDPDPDLVRPQRFDNELQVDPELKEEPASTGKVALFAVGLALVLGAVFYGLNNTSVKEAQTTPSAQTAQTQPAAPPPGMRDVTPKPNTEPGTTTGAAPSRPAPPQADQSKQ